MKRRIEAKDVYTETVGALYDEGDVSRGPMSRDMLLHLAAEHGVGPDSLVLDIGCANGGVSRKLLERTGCRIEGVELLDFLVEMGKKDNSIAGVDGRFAIQQGSILDIPFENNHFDFVVCIDVLGMVDDVSKALVECRRVLKPQGKMLIYTSFPTDRLSDREARELNETQGGSRKELDEARAERCMHEQFKVVEKRVIGSQFTQYDTENAKDASEATQNLLRVARLLTWPDEYIKKYGEQNYRICLAGSHWNVFILLGKLKPTVFIVQKT